MTGAVALPRVIVDHLRAERGSIVDTAIEMGEIEIVEQKEKSNNGNCNKN